MSSPYEKLTFKLETNGSSYEDEDLSMEGFVYYVNHFSPDDWDFMTLCPSVPIKGSSFIQVGSPEAITDYKMTLEIGFQKSKGVELYRYYTDDKAVKCRREATSEHNIPTAGD